MKNTTFALFAALLMAVGLSADTSHTFGPLKDSPAFRSRVNFILVMQAPVVLTEPQTNVTPPNTYTAQCHTLRANLAAAVVRDPGAYAPVFAAHLVANINVTSAGALTGTLAAGTLDSPVTDAALLAAAADRWSHVAGCIINP